MKLRLQPAQAWKLHHECELETKQVTEKISSLFYFMTLLLQHVSIPSHFQRKNQPSQILIGHKCMSVCVAKHVIVSFQKAVSCYTVQQETFKRRKVFGL